MAPGGLTGRARLTAVVSGSVQGVGFRAYTISEARRLGISGYVKNRADGSVEAVAEGPEGVIGEFLAALRRGPGGSVVKSVDERWEEWSGEFTGFTVRY